MPFTTLLAACCEAVFNSSSATSSLDAARQARQRAWQRERAASAARAHLAVTSTCTPIK